MLRRSDEQRAGAQTPPKRRGASAIFSRDGHAGEEELEGREGDDEAEAAQGVQHYSRCRPSESVATVQARRRRSSVVVISPSVDINRTLATDKSHNVCVKERHATIDYVTGPTTRNAPPSPPGSRASGLATTSTTRREKCARLR